jgi:hypothetical protein
MPLTGLTTRTENLRHKLYMISFFSSPDLFDDLHNKTVNVCGTVILYRKEMKGSLRVFWDVVLCSHVEVDGHFKVRTASIIRAMMEADCLP